MSTVRKFTFDLDFDAPEEPEVVEAEAIEDEPEVEYAPTYSEEDLERARQEGFDAGKESGRLEAAEATEQRLLEAVEAAAQKLKEVFDAQADANRDVAKEMILIANTITKKMFPDLNARNALGEVERVAQDTLKAITEEPRVQIVLHPDIREPFMERLTVMTNRAGFDGKVFVNPDPSLPLGDCRIEWSNGAAVRDSEELSKMIDEIVKRNLHDEDDALDDPATDPQADSDEAPEAERSEPEPEQEQVQEPAPEPASKAPSAPEADPQAEVTPTPEMDDTPDTTESATASATGESTPGDMYADGDDTDEAPQTPEIEPAPAMDTADDEMAEASAETDFAPTLEPETEPAEAEDIQENQGLDPEIDTPPVPHIDDDTMADDDGGADAEQEKPPAPAFTSPDPVSPEMATAILDAQGMDEDDPDSNA